MASYLLDTTVAIGLRDGEPVIAERVSRLTGAILISVITRVELEGGVYREPRLATVRRTRVDEMLAMLSILAFDQPDAEAYGRIVAAVGFSRRKIVDRMIAAQALVHRATLVTSNGADFRDIPGLLLEVW